MKDLRAEDFINSVPEKKYMQFDDENDTYALRELKIAAQAKQIWNYILALGIPDNRQDKLAIYYYYNQKYKSIANQHIFRCREKMQPSKWYYKLTEKLPERIKFTPKHEVQDLMYKESAGHVKFRELQKQYTVQGLADKYDLNFYQIKNILYKRLNPLTGRECFKILPPAQLIIKLRDVINPDLWYIFPDEMK